MVGFYVMFTAVTLIAMLTALPRLICALIVLAWLFWLAKATRCVDVARKHRHWLEQVEWTQVEKSQPPMKDWLHNTMLVQDQRGSYEEKDVSNKRKYAISMGSQMWRVKPWRDIVYRVHGNPLGAVGNSAAQAPSQQDGDQ